MDLRVAPNFASFDAPRGEAPGCPSASVHPSRLSMSPRVAPAPASSGLAGDGHSSCPESRILQRLWRVSPGSPHSLALTVAPTDEVPGLPRFLHLPALPATDLRVTPNLASFGASGAESSGCPSAPLFQLRLPVHLRVSPLSAPSGFALGLSLRVTPNPRSLGAG